MIWTQCSLCLLGWIGIGIYLRGSSGRLAERLKRYPRAKRVIIGGASMIGGMLVLMLGLSLVGALGGMQKNGLVPWAWFVVFLIGGGFVFLQVLGAMTMVTLMERETRPLPETSDPHESESEHEEIPSR